MNFIEDKQLIEDAKSLGFIEIEAEEFKCGGSHGYTLEQLERWLWEKHKNIYNEIFIPLLGKSYYSDNPFTARLEGVKKAIQYLKGKEGGK